MTQAPNDSELMKIRLAERGENPFPPPSRDDIVTILTERDGMTRREALGTLEDLRSRIYEEDPEELLAEIGLEPDYWDELLPF